MNILWSIAKLPKVEWKKWFKQLFLNAWSISIQEKFDRFGKRWIGKTYISAIRDSMFWAVSRWIFFSTILHIFSVQSEVSKKLVEAAFQTNANILKTDNSKLWKYFKTRDFKEICQSQKFIEETSLRFIRCKDSGKTGKPTWRGRLSTVDLLELTSLDRLLFLLKILITCYKISYINQEVSSTMASP